MKNNRKAVLAAVILFFLALGITANPVVSNFLYDRHRSLVETAYFEAMEQLDDETIRKAKQEAEEYNALLSKGISGDLNNEEMNTYNNILNVNGDGIMAYIRIPAIDIDLPISHGKLCGTCCGKLPSCRRREYTRGYIRPQRHGGAADVYRPASTEVRRYGLYSCVE